MKIWKQTLESPNYEISNDGNVRNIKRKVNITLAKNNSGYFRWRRNLNGKVKHEFVHRSIWKAFNGDIPEGYTINHIDCNKENNNLDNLECISFYENYKHFMKTNKYKIKCANHSNFMIGENIRRKLNKTK